MKNKIVVVMLVIVMIATFAGTAFAEPPRRQSWEDPYHFVVDCGDFDVLLDGTVRISVTYFSHGNSPNAYEWQYQYDGMITSTATGHSFADHTTYNGRRHLTGEQHLQGVVFHINVPGEGVVMLVAGRIVWDADGVPSFIAGQGMYEMWEDPGEEAMLCESMAGL